MTLDISATSPRVQYTVGSSSTTTFAYGFPIFQDADLKVFVGSTLKTLTTHYTVTGAGTTSGGNVVMTTGNEVTNADVTIVRDITISRTTDFPTSGSFQVDSLNTELDTITAVQQELEDDISRSLKLSDEDATATLTLPLKDARKGRYLAFNATTGNAEAGPTQTDATLIATVTSDIATLADIQDGTTATNAITTVASNSSNVTTVAGISANVTTVAGISSDVTAVAGDATDIGAVAGKATEIGRLGTADAVADMALLGTSDVVADMALLATTDVIADMALLADADVISDMNTLATSDIISDLNTLATSDIVTDMNLLATSANVTAMGHLGTSANVTAMGLLGTSAVVEDMGFLGTSANVTAMGHLGTSANVTAMGLLGTSAVVEDMGFLGTSANVTAMGNLGTSTNVTNMANLNASGVISNIATVAGAVSNVNTVATNISGVNSFADRYRVASSAPTSSLDVGDLYFDTTANELKVYKSSGWSAAGSTVNGTSARFHYNISGTPTTVTGADANGNTLAYDAGFIDVYVNGVRMSPDDITVTSGTSVVFASALSNGDDVDIVAFGTFQVANIVSTGALNSGSITSGFGNIDTGSSTITTTGAISGGTLTGTLQTASQTNITGVGALDAGSITSGFGSIDNGSSSITTTGAISGGTLTGTLQTASQTNITSVGTLTGLTVADNAGGDINITTNSQAGTQASPLNMDINFKGSSNVTMATIRSHDESSSTGHGELQFHTNKNGVGFREVVNIDHDGHLDVKLGNVKIGTSGQGIDFSATANSGGSMSSELLDDYEEGTFTPTLYYQNTSGLTLNYDNQTGHYTKIGRMVHVYISIQADISGSLVNDNLGLRGLPYSVGVSAGSTGSLVNVVNATGSGANTNYTLQPDGVTLYFSNSQGNGNLADDVGTGTNVLFQVMTWYISS